jgi:hypothetical protein
VLFYDRSAPLSYSTTRGPGETHSRGDPGSTLHDRLQMQDMDVLNASAIRASCPAHTPRSVCPPSADGLRVASISGLNVSKKIFVRAIAPRNELDSS